MTKTPETLVYVSITGLSVRHPHHTATVPGWADVPRLWREQGRDV